MLRGMSRMASMSASLIVTAGGPARWQVSGGTRNFRHNTGLADLGGLTRPIPAPRGSRRASQGRLVDMRKVSGPGNELHGRAAQTGLEYGREHAGKEFVIHAQRKAVRRADLSETAPRGGSRRTCSCPRGADRLLPAVDIGAVGPFGEARGRRAGSLMTSRSGPASRAGLSGSKFTGGSPSNIALNPAGSIRTSLRVRCG